MTTSVTRGATAAGTSVPSTRPRAAGLLPARLRPRGRPRFWVELAFSVALYLTYSRIRRFAPDHRTAAMHRAAAIWHAERTLHLDPELAVNHAVNHVTWLIVGMNYYYATLHFVVTLGVLVWLYACRPAAYRGARTALYAATFLALVGFEFFALAPPRFLTGQGFVDTVVVHDTWGSWGSGSSHVSSVSNQYAAMPSVHIVWAAWSGLTVAALARRTWVRVLGICYPLATLTVIVATANHFLADAAGGALTLAAGFLVQRLLTGRPAYDRGGVDRPVDRPVARAAGGPATGSGASARPRPRTRPLTRLTRPRTSGPGAPAPGAGPGDRATGRDDGAAGPYATTAARATRQPGHRPGPPGGDGADGRYRGD